MKYILKFVSWVQLILGGFFLIMPLCILIYLSIQLILWQPITNANKGQFAMWPIIVLPLVFFIGIAIPQFIVGFSSVRNRNYSKKILIPLALFFLQLYYLIEIMAPVKTVPLFSADSSISKNEIGLLIFALLFIINLVISILLSINFHKSKIKV